MNQVSLLLNFYLFPQFLLSRSQEIIREDNNSASLIVTKAVPREGISYYINEEGALCLETGNDFILLTNYLSTLSEEEFQNWGMSNGTFFDVSKVTPNNPGCDKHILVTYNK